MSEPQFVTKVYKFSSDIVDRIDKFTEKYRTEMFNKHGYLVRGADAARYLIIYALDRIEEQEKTDSISSKKNKKS